MDRREVLKYTALLTGVAVGAPLIATIMSGCKAEIKSDEVVANGKLYFFKEDQFALVKDLVDTILPKTDSPSASDVGVHQMIDSMVGQAYNEEDRKNYKLGFEALAGHLWADNKGKNFNTMDHQAKMDIVNNIEISENQELKVVKRAYKDLKQQTIAYYLSTEEIGTKFLNYLPIPGAYEGCITLDSVGGKKWAI